VVQKSHQYNSQGNCEDTMHFVNITFDKIFILNIFPLNCIQGDMHFRNDMKVHEGFGMNYNGRLKGRCLFIFYS